ncbi:MAG: flavodoxin family protein [Gammaproteobacteria bacterium]|nr:flavodoxin family protein [Gammaproteobacteria bacterium]
MTRIKLLGVSGSPKKKGSNTTRMVVAALEGAAAIGGVETELVELGKLTIEQCTGCRACRTKKVPYCPVIEDDMNALCPKLMKADGIILGSPVYFASVTSLTKAFMDRTTCLGGAVGFPLKYKVGTGITVGGTRHGGQELTLAMIRNYFLMMGGIVVSGIPPHGYWGGAGVAGDISEDEWDLYGQRINALDVCRDLGHRIAVVCRLLKAGVTAEGEDLLSFDLGKTRAAAY